MPAPHVLALFLGTNQKHRADIIKKKKSECTLSHVPKTKSECTCHVCYFFGSIEGMEEKKKKDHVGKMKKVF